MKKHVKYIAIDFDGTITTGEENFPEINPMKHNVKEVIDNFRSRGAILTLWTCRTDEPLLNAIDFLNSNEIYFDYINENPPERIQKYGNDCRKVGADWYIDDKFLLPINWIDLLKFSYDNVILPNDICLKNNDI